MSQPSSQPSSQPYGPSSRQLFAQTNGKATASLVTGISTLVLSWCCGLGVLGVVAVVLGARARSEIRASAGTQTGEGLALGGIVTGTLAVLIGLVVLALVVIALATLAPGDLAPGAGIADR